MSRARWMCEGRRFDALDGGPTQEQDGLVASSLARSWNAAFVRDKKCLVDHSPSLRACLADPKDAWVERDLSCVALPELQKRPGYRNGKLVPFAKRGAGRRCFDAVPAFGNDVLQYLRAEGGF